MSEPLNVPRSRVNRHSDGVRTPNDAHRACREQAGADGSRVAQADMPAPGFRLSDTVGVRSSVRPGRGRTRAKPELDEKIKKPGEEVRKKSPPARKAPSRGRYVDEYARPPH
jgi:hypothetical protein